MKRLVFLLAGFALVSGCKREAPSESPSPASAEALADRGTPVVDEPVVDEIAEAALPSSKVDAALVQKYLTYRKQVVARARKILETMRAADAGVKTAANSRIAGSVRAQQATESWGEQMRQVEETVRSELSLSREDVVAVGQVTAEVLAARQIWRVSGGDEAVVAARAELEKLPKAERAKAEKRLETKAAGFVQMRDAQSARKRFGDAAVDAVLQHEDALISVQREGSKIMAGVY